MSDYAFMKTGLMGSETSNAQIHRLLAIAVAMVSESQKTAMEYCQHQKRTIVTIPDVKKGLRYQARNFLFSDDCEQNVQEMHDRLLQSESDTESNDSDFIDEIEEEEIPCNCTKCQAIRECEDHWDSWNPDDVVGKFIKTTLDKSISEMD
jgi:hypothetical protein